VSGAIRKAASPISSAKTPPGPKATSRPEHGILDDAGEKLRAASDEWLDDERAPDLLGGRTNGLFAAEVDRDTARLRLVRARARPS
jgi:hypothetical protein